MHDDYTPQPRDRAAYIPTYWDPKPTLSTGDKIAASVTLACILAICVFAVILGIAYFDPTSFGR